MTTDLRKLLKEAREELEATLDIQASQDLKRFVERIDAALAEKAPEPMAMYDAIWSEFGGSEFDDMRRKVSADQLRRLFYMFARHWASGTVPLTVYESAVHGRQELRQALREARAAPPPASTADVRDAARYKWLAYVGDSSWTPLCKRDNGPGGQLFEQYIDAAYECFRKSQRATK